MTTYFPFNPSNISPPQFQPTLDGEVCTCIVTWNLFGQRYYVNCYDGSGTLIFSVALIETDAAIPLNSVVWNENSLSVELTTQYPHNYPIGSTLNLTVTGATPSKYNGTYLMLVDSQTTLNYVYIQDPPSIISPGQLSYLISLSKGYFNSTLVYRNGQFEVSP